MMAVNTGPKWTQAQRAAIDTRDRDVLVTASAGTGKTAVLAQRCVQILSDPDDPTDVSRILVLTFTDAAAEEMRSRIASQLRGSFFHRRDEFLRRQVLQLDLAYISTIHSFCKRVLDENFYRLGLDPTYRIIDGDEQRLLKTQALDELLDEAWADPALSAGMSRLLHRRDLNRGGRGFMNRVIAISEFLEGVVGRKEWYERARFLAEEAGFGSFTVEQARREVICDIVTDCRDRLQYAIQLDERLIDGGLYGPTITDGFLGPIEEVLAALEDGRDIATVIRLIRQAEMGDFRRTRKPKDVPAEAADLVKSTANDAKGRFKRLRAMSLVNPDYERLVLPELSLQTRVLVELVERFDRIYSRMKRDLNGMDFVDLERRMLELLDGEPTIAAQLRNRFRYIFVDEYQDINAVQQAILDRIRQADNVFVVGDVKQSIYAFRQSRPEIFLAHLRRAAEQQGDGGPTRVDLRDNFRSRPEVLTLANHIFERIMRSSLASIDYDRRAQLQSGFAYRPVEEVTQFGGVKHPVELYVLNESDPEDACGDAKGGDENGSGERENGDDFEAVITASQRQAAFIARRIQEMVGAQSGGRAQFQVYDRQMDQYRDVRYGDIVILMRSVAGRANEYVEILRLAGIPVSSQSSAGYFQAIEITDMLSLLKVLDNPRRDVELAAVLRSAIFNVSDADLLRIRMEGETPEDLCRADLYSCTLRYSRTGGDERLRKRLAEVLATLSEWRRIGRRESLADLIWRVYRTTGYLAFVSGLPNGRQRKANLYKLHDRAIQFEGFSGGMQATSLARFVEFVERLLEEDQDWAPAEPDGAVEDAVRIMSVHKSKGLEFPVVFLAEMQRQFNRADTVGDCLFNEPDALGLEIIDPSGRVKIRGVGHEIIAHRQNALMLAEEMRILYVAITRARERLVLCGSRKEEQVRPILTACAMADGEPIPDWQLRQVSSHFDWVLYGLGDQRPVLDLLGLPEAGRAADHGLLTAGMLGRDELNDISREVMEEKRQIYQAERPDPASRPVSHRARKLYDRVLKAVDWRYANEAATVLDAKHSVSELTHRRDEFARRDFALSLKKLPAVMAAGGRRFVAARREIGTATHLLIQALDLSRPVTAEAVAAAGRQLAGRGRLAAGMPALVDVDSIVNFFQGSLGRRILASPRVYREWSFTMAIDADRLDPAAVGEKVVVQGVVDLIFETDAGPVVIDFKTDQVENKEQLDQRVATYSDQVRYYCEAVERIMKHPPAGCYLHFLGPGLTVEVTP